MSADLIFFWVRFWSIFRFAKLQKSTSEIWLSEAYTLFRESWKQECLKLLETNDRVSVGEHWTKTEIKQNQTLQRCCCFLSVTLFFLPFVGKDGNPVVTWSCHHGSSDCDFQAAWARSGFYLRWCMRMTMTGKIVEQGTTEPPRRA